MAKHGTIYLLNFSVEKRNEAAPHVEERFVKSLSEWHSEFADIVRSDREITACRLKNVLRMDCTEIISDELINGKYITEEELKCL